MAAALDQITDFPALVEYLRDELEWPIPEDISLDDATYDVTPEELGLKAEAIGGGIEIKQLRPLNRAQPWGVFFLNLPNAKLPVTLVRNILGKLAVKKRASANKSQQAAFAKHDLLFIAATGASSERRLAFAHFANDEIKGDAAILKVLGWDANDTPRRLGLTEASLKIKLHWPDDPTNADHWRKQWGEAFTHSDTRAVVRDSRAMAVALAALARRIRERAKELIAAQTDTGSLVQLHRAFKEALIHDLTPEGFADTYAQTIAYGLLSAAISRSSGALVQENVTDVVHPTSPFLKEMLGTFIEAGGRRPGKANAGLDFDELGITEVVELLRNADMEAVLADFDRRNPDEDPVIHFYELFLREYDAEQKVKRGVFYTPRPVVGFIVRSVDEVLRTEFGLEDGLASTATWGEVIATSKGKEGADIKLPEGAKASDPFVRILDPATGTGTFLVECVDLIHKTMVRRWSKEGLGKGPTHPNIKALWNEYVPKHLLPRLTGFELMMAPYAIAHVKLGLKLADTGYNFGSDARAQIYLTNALEPAQDLDMQLDFMSEALAHEAKAANEAKEVRFTAVIGNPPYSNFGQLNQMPSILALLSDYKRDLDEKKINLNDDFIKFIRFAQHSIVQSNVGVIGFITNNVFIDGITHRQMRKHLLGEFDRMMILDLHGSSRKQEVAPDGSLDENVFDIQQGVGISIFIRRETGLRATVMQGDLWGSYDTKVNALTGRVAPELATSSLSPREPQFWLAPRREGPSEYVNFPKVQADIFIETNAGIQTKRDELVYSFTEEELIKRTAHFCSLGEKDARRVFGLPEDGRDWTVRAAQMDLGSGKAINAQILRRPFDLRWSRYSGRTKGFMAYPRAPLMLSALSHNVLLLTVRNARRGNVDSFFVSRGLVDKDGVSPFDNATFFPLYRYNVQQPEVVAAEKAHVNIAPAFAVRVAACTGLTYDDCVEGAKQAVLGGILPKKAEQTAMFAPAPRERGQPGKGFGPRDLFDYTYAVLHSLDYRKRYADYLKSDFARIPLPGSRGLFEALVALGTELVALHLLDVETLPFLKDPKGIRLAGSGEARVEKKPEFNAALGRVEISARRWFEIVPQVAWDFPVGGYHPAQKWLKDRAAKGGKKAIDGRVLTDDDILHYRRIIVALTRTAELMPMIDEVIEKHGGWPGAFRGMTDEPTSVAAE